MSSRLLRSAWAVSGLLLLFWSTAPAADRELRGVATVIDGDTLEVAGRRVRLAGIDAPEAGQICRRGGRDLDCGAIATAQLMDITVGAAVACRPGEPGSAVRNSARCNAAGFDLGYGMVYAGWALATPEAQGRYAAVEAEARAARRGIWRYRFVPPWEWRRGNRLSGAVESLQR